MVNLKTREVVGPQLCFPNGASGRVNGKPVREAEAFHRNALQRLLSVCVRRSSMSFKRCMYAPPQDLGVSQGTELQPRAPNGEVEGPPGSAQLEPRVHTLLRHPRRHYRLSRTRQRELGKL